MIRDHHSDVGDAECEDDFFVWKPPTSMSVDALRGAIGSLRHLEATARVRGEVETADDWAALIAAYNVALERAENLGSSD